MEPRVALIEVQEGPKPNKAKPNQATKQGWLPPQLRLLNDPGPGPGPGRPEAQQGKDQPSNQARVVATSIKTFE